MASVRAILAQLKSLGSPENVAGMARYGITVRDAYGVPLPQIKSIAKELGRDHALALELWKTGNREARMLAIFIADPKHVTIGQMNGWARDFDSWDICDGCAIHLFRKSPHAWERAFQWARERREFVRRAGFALFASLTVHDKRADDEQFLEILPLIEAASEDDRNFVKKAVNWALRTIGKRNPRLHKPALELAHRLASATNATARWIGNDAARELSASASRSRSSRPSYMPSKRRSPDTPDRPKIPRRRLNPD